MYVQMYATISTENQGKTVQKYFLGPEIKYLGEPHTHTWNGGEYYWIHLDDVLVCALTQTERNVSTELEVNRSKIKKTPWERVLGNQGFSRPGSRSYHMMVVWIAMEIRKKPKFLLALSKGKVSYLFCLEKPNILTFSSNWLCSINLIKCLKIPWKGIVEVTVPLPSHRTHHRLKVLCRRIVKTPSFLTR